MDPEQDGARLLAPLREVEPRTPSTVNVHRAVHTGARRQWLHRAAAGAAAVVVTALAVAIVPGIVRDHRDVPPAAPAGEFDVRRQAFTVGSAGGFTPVSYETGRHRQRVRLVSPGSDHATVTAYARGWLPDGWTPGGEAAPDVNGRRAFWSQRDDEVAWEWAPGAWAFASVGGGVDARTKAHRVAQSVAQGDKAVSVPFTVPRPAAGAPERLLGVIVPYGTSSDATAGALLVFGTQDAPAPGGEPDRTLVGVQRDLGRDLVSGQPRSVPPASVLLSGGFSALADGAGEPQRLAELASSVRLVPNPGDPHSWAPDPLR